MSTVFSKLINNVNSKQVITIGDLLSTVDSLELQLYENNRGRKPAIRETVNSVRDNLDVMALGEFHISVDLKTKTAVLGDGHNRLEGLMERRDLRKSGLPKSELDAPVSVAVGDMKNFLGQHTLVNKNKAHTTKDRLANPDYAVGKLLTETADRFSGGNDLKKKRFSMRFGLTLACLYYNFRKIVANEVDWFAGVYESRKYVREHADEAATDNFSIDGIVISNSHINKMCEAIQYAFAYVERVKQWKKKSNQKGAKDLWRKLFLGFIMMDYLRPTPKFAHISAEKLADQCWREKERLDNSLDRFGLSKQDVNEKVERSVFKILSK